jgi:putative transcriptional regulator
MSKFESIYETHIREYGKISVTLKDVLDKHNKTRYFLAKSTGVKYSVVDAWYKNSISRVDLDILARFCFVLGCRAEDIIKYTP